MQKMNYQKEMEKSIEKLCGRTPKLLLHVCCAPCGSYVINYLSEFFNITAFYYNPNISPEAEYKKRAAELKRLIAQMPVKNAVCYSEGRYDPQRFFETVKGREDDTEGGAHCMLCYEMRLRETASYAKENGFEYFTTTLSVSPYKNAQRLNSIGGAVAREYGVNYLYSDFKKKDGYLKSISLSHEYGLYRQNYCGCVFSQRERAAAQLRAGTAAPL